MAVAAGGATDRDHRVEFWNPFLSPSHVRTTPGRTNMYDLSPACGLLGIYGRMNARLLTKLANRKVDWMDVVPLSFASVQPLG